MYLVDSDLLFLVYRAQEGDNRAAEIVIREMLQYCAHRLCQRYSIRGYATEDMESVIIIGLLEAIRDYKDETISSFRTFAWLCAEREIQNILKESRRKKRLIPEGMELISLDGHIEDHPETEEAIGKLDPMVERICSFSFAAEVAKCPDAELRQRFGLARQEAKVLSLRRLSLSYPEIARRLNIDVKSVDNAIQRIHRKLWRQWKESL